MNNKFDQNNEIDDLSLQMLSIYTQPDDNEELSPDQPMKKRGWVPTAIMAASFLVPTIMNAFFSWKQHQAEMERARLASDPNALMQKNKDFYSSLLSGAKDPNQRELIEAVKNTANLFGLQPHQAFSLVTQAASRGGSQDPMAKAILPPNMLKAIDDRQANQAFSQFLMQPQQPSLLEKFLPYL